MKCKLFPTKRKNVISIQEAKQKSGWEITSFNLPSVWSNTQGEGVIIALLDTGSAIHEDLIDNILDGINVINPKKSVVDLQGHATACSGIICANNNEIGVVGVAPKARILPIKVLDDDGNGEMSDVAKGIRLAVEKKVDIISLSLGCPKKLQQVRKAIQYAANHNIVTFAAAGNAGDNNYIFYPACYPETLSISAIDKKFIRAKFSNIAPNLDFFAPGVEILTTAPNNWYTLMSGTSMACPWAVGVAALCLSYVKNNKTKIKLETVDDYRRIFKNGITPINSKTFSGFSFIEPSKLINWMVKNS